MSHFIMKLSATGSNSPTDAAYLAGFGAPQDAALAQDFGKVMDGLVSSSGTDHQTSLLSQFMRVPTLAYTQAMASVNTPVPSGLSVADQMQFATQKVIDVTQMKTVVGAFHLIGKQVKKGVETILNNKG